MDFIIAEKNRIIPPDISDIPGGLVIPVDKPYLWTSADVVRKLKFKAQHHFRKKNLKVGHAGTLDPLATGVLLVCVGNATKKAEELQAHDKEYIADITFGATTPSYDMEKEIDREFAFGHITPELIREKLPSFIGEQDQIAPLFSAKSIDGVRAYEIARKMIRQGDFLSVADAAEAGIRSSRICISDLEILAFGNDLPPIASDSGEHHRIARRGSITGYPTLRIRIACSKGTYIRAFARDLGEALDSGAFLSGLQRSRSGIFTVENALSIDEATGLFDQDRKIFI